MTTINVVCINYAFDFNKNGLLPCRKTVSIYNHYVYSKSLKKNCERSWLLRQFFVDHFISVELWSPK